MKIIVFILAVYFLVFFPIANLAFPGNRFIYAYWHIFYFSSVLVLAFALKLISLQQLGFNNFNKKIALILGLLPIIIVPLLDDLLIETGFSQSEMFAGAELRNPAEMGFSKSLTVNIFTTTLISFIDQLFVTGLIVSHLLKKQHAGQAMIGGGLLYSIIHFKPSLGNLFLGMISVALLRTTDSIMVPMLVHAGFAIAEVLIVFQYPRLISLLIFRIS